MCKPDDIRSFLALKSYGIMLPDAFPVGDSLFVHGIIDSFGLFSFVTDIQSKFNIAIENKEINPHNFETISKIAEFVKRKREAME